MEVIKGKEPITQIARKHQVSDAIIHKWRERFYEGGKTALNFESGTGAARSREQTLEQQIEELEKVIGQQAVEIRFLKNCPRCEAELECGRGGSCGRRDKS
jgi:transposase-like protein